MKDEALRLALDALDALDALENHCGNYKLDDAGCDRHEKAINAINQALAQPAVPAGYDLKSVFIEGCGEIALAWPPAAQPKK